MYILERQQRVTGTLEQAWAFLQDPANLDRITPPDLQFRIVTDIPAVMTPFLIAEHSLIPKLIHF
jgi:ligand-binding SRPBCC domain-containing protein